jgi:hypothetical protein
MEFHCRSKNKMDKIRLVFLLAWRMAGVRLSLDKIVFITISFLLLWFLSLFPPQLNGATHPPLSLMLLDRTITQDQGAWIIEYRFRNVSDIGIILTPEEIKVKIEGWVSNSRLSSHAIPRWSCLVARSQADLTTHSDVIVAGDESHRCRERLAILVWAESACQSNSKLASKNQDSVKTVPMPVSDVLLEPVLPLSLEPGSVIHLRLRIDHQHILYGDYDPLLGIRTMELSFGSFIVRDLISLDREQYLAQPKYTWPAPPDDRRDTRHFVSAPDSLHLQADVHGHQAYRYQERPVRYNTRMMLRFWYLIAAGTEGECRIRVRQNKDTPLAWRQLHDASFEEQLRTIGHWTKYERIVQTELEATKLILEFKIEGEMNVGEMWIDDLSLELIDSTKCSGP